MGLDTTHDAFHGAYSSFNRWRQIIAKAMGGSFPPHEDETLDRGFWYFEDDEFSEDTHPGLFELLNHSDCDGEISPEMCQAIADELETLLPKIEEIIPFERGGHVADRGGYVEVTKQFIAGCRLAASRNERLEFL